MAYGVCRGKNHSAASIGAMEIHNERKFDELGKETPANIHKELSHLNTHVICGEGNEGLSITQSVNKKLKELKIKPRSNSVIALEYVMALTGNPEERKKMWYNYDKHGFLQQAKNWLAERHGGLDNVLSFSVHLDEGNPHIHVVILPIVEKTVKWKNQKGKGERVEKRLCARDYTGHPDKLRQLQTDYHKFIETFQDKMQVKFYRGTKKEEQARKYVQATDHILGDLRAKLDKIIDLAEAKAIKLELEAKKAEFEKKQGEDGRSIEAHKNYLGKTNEQGLKNWKKDLDMEMM